MGLLDTVKLPEGAKKRTSVLDGVKVPVNRGAAFEMQSLQQRLATQEKTEKKDSTMSLLTPFTKFGQGYKEYEPSKTKGMLNAYNETTREMAMHQTDTVGNAFRPAVEGYMNGDVKKADVVAGLMKFVLSGVNTAFAPVMGASIAAEQIPGVGVFAEFFNRATAGLGNTGAFHLGQTFQAVPDSILDQETKAKLQQPMEELGGLVGIVLGMKGAGKAGGYAGGKVLESKYVKPKLEALEKKAAEIQKIILSDANITRKLEVMGKNQGAARNVPVKSEGSSSLDVTDSSTRIPVTPNQKQAAYSQKMRYEPIVPDSQLPTISIGDKAPSKELPTIDAVTGEVRTPVTDTSIQPSLEIPKRPTSELLIERENAPAVTTPKQGEPIKGSTAEIQSVPGKSEGVAEKADAVTVNGGTYQLRGATLENYKQKLAEHNAYTSRLREEYVQAKNAGQRQLIQKQLKAEGMQWSAQVRDITGNLTATEIKGRITYEKGNYEGKSVLVEINGKWVKATIAGKPAYGNIKVKLEDGTELSVKTANIKDPRTAKEIKELVTKREESSLYEEKKKEETGVEKEPEYLSDEYNQMLFEMEQAEAGKRNFAEQEGTMDLDVTGASSTFPSWIPSDLRKSTYVDKYLSERNGTTKDLDIVNKKGSPMDRMHKAFIEELKFREENTNKRKETERLEEEARAMEPKEDTASAEAEYAQQAPMEPRAGGSELPAPVEGTGKTKTAGLSARAEALQKEFETIADGHPLYNKAEGTYQGMKMADLTERVDLMSTEQLRSMVRDPSMIPADLPGSFVWRALGMRNKTLKDPMITAELFRSDIAGFVTRSAQEMRALVGIDKGSPEYVVDTLIKEREALFEKNTKKETKKVKDSVVSQIREFVMKEEITVKDVEAFIKEITCK